MVGNETPAATGGSSLRRSEGGKGMGAVSSAPGTGRPFDDSVYSALREYLGIRPSLLQFLAKHGPGKIDRHSHLRLGGEEVGSEWASARLRAVKTTCVKTVTYVALLGSLGSMIGWYWDEFLHCLNQPIRDVQFGPALLWSVLAVLFVRTFNRLV